MTLKRANTILVKLGLPSIREGTRSEHKWVVDHREFRQYRGRDNLGEALRMLIQDHFETATSNWGNLTEKEQAEIQKHVPEVTADGYPK